MPQINNTVLQLTLFKAPLLVDGNNKCSNTPQAMASIPRSTRKTSAPTATAMMPVRVTMRTRFTPLEGAD